MTQFTFPNATSTFHSSASVSQFILYIQQVSELKKKYPLGLKRPKTKILKQTSVKF